MEAIDVLISPDTPWENYEGIWVKREDLSCPEGPRFSKIRGVYENLSKLPVGTTVGVLDTVHSKGGWGVAYICEALGLKCIDFYPGPTPRSSQLKAQEHGASLIPLKPGRSAILFHQAKKTLSALVENGYMMPNGLQLEESVQATRRIVELTPDKLLGGTWVVSASTGTIAAGVFQGLRGRAHLVVHLGFSRSHNKLRQRVGEEITIIDEGYEYKDSVDYPCPFPCNPYYDLKAWRWLKSVPSPIKPLKEPVVFWNIGD